MKCDMCKEELKPDINEWCGKCKVSYCSYEVGELRQQCQDAMDDGFPFQKVYAQKLYSIIKDLPDNQIVEYVLFDGKLYQRPNEWLRVLNLKAFL